MPLIWMDQAALDARYAPLTRPSIRVRNSATFFIVTGIASPIAFDTNEWETLPPGITSQHSLASNTDSIFCRVAGKYVVSASVEFDSNAVGERLMNITINSVAVAAERIGPNPSGVTVLSATSVVSLAVGDVVKMVLFQSSGGNLNVNSSFDYSPVLSMAFIGR